MEDEPKIQNTDRDKDIILMGEDLEKSQKLEELKKKADIIQDSTKTSLKSLAPIHNYLRSRFSWYYNWHLDPKSAAIHRGALLGFIISFFLFLMFQFMNL